MKRINIGRVILAGLVAGLAFIFVEIVLEGFVWLIFGINENKMLKEAFDISPRGVLFHILNLAIFFAECILIMGIYAAIRPRFRLPATAAITASLIFWFFALLILANQINLGVFPLKLVLISLGFNLIELPVAILVGSNVYKEN